MKLWFIEPRPNVFISSVKDATAKKVVAYLHQFCPQESGLMVIREISKTPHYEITGLGDMRRSIVEISGLQLVLEKDDIYYTNPDLPSSHPVIDKPKLE